MGAHDHYGTVLEADPEQQGLKLSVQGYTRRDGTVLEADPEQQGLKPYWTDQILFQFVGPRG